RDNNHYDSLIGCIHSPADRVNTIRIKGKDCAAVTRRARLVIPEPSLLTPQT
ncbi:hypothetical protein KI387_005764, partial [Taxus chinensis]